MSWIISRMTWVHGKIRLGLRILYFDTLMLTLVVWDQCQQWPIPRLVNFPRRNTVCHSFWPPILLHGPPTTTTKTPSMTMMLLPFPLLLIHQWITMPPLALTMRCYCPWCSHISILSWSPTFKNMPPGKASCLQSTLNDPSPPRSLVISFLEKAITCWDWIRFKIQHKQEGVIFVALQNLMAVSRVLNAVFLSNIFGVPAIGISWLL